MKTKKKAFTLIELMVAMGVVAVLAGMSIVAIGLVQRSLRDTQRRDALNSMNLALVDYYNNNNQTFPSASVTPMSTLEVANTSSITIGTQTIELNGALRVNTGTGTTSTTNSSTNYCYTSTGGTFSLGVRLEGGGTFHLGEAADCSL